MASGVEASLCGESAISSAVEAEERRAGGQGAFLGGFQSCPIDVIEEAARQKEGHGQGRARGEADHLLERGQIGLFAEVHGDTGGDHDGRPTRIEAGGGELVPP